MFKTLARRGAVVLVNANGMGRQGFCATLTAFIIVSTLLWQACSLSTSPSFARFMTGFTAIAACLPLGFVVIRWLLRPKLLVALSHSGGVGLRVTGEAEWLPPDALRMHGHEVDPSGDNSRMHHATHTFGLGTRTLRVDGLFHDPLAAQLGKPLERLFDDVCRHACQHAEAATKPALPSTVLRHVAEPIFVLPRAFIRTPIQAFDSLPFRPIWLLWRMAQKLVDVMLGACFASTLMRKLPGPHESCMQGGATLTVKRVKSPHLRRLGHQSQVVRYSPLPQEIPASLCGRHQVGALGLRYVDQLRGCDPT